MNRKDNGPQVVTQSIVSTLKKLFQNHRATVRRLNEEKKQKAGIKPDQSESKFISKCSELRQPVSKLIQDVQANEKVRREKKNSYLEKLRDLSKALENIQKRKSIGIKANDFVADLPNTLLEMIGQVTRLQTDYLKNLGVFSCGNNDFKGLYEVMMNNVTERAFFITNILSLQSKTAQPNLIEYHSVEFDQRQFSTIQQEVEKSWPAPVVIDKIVPPSVQIQKEIVTEIKHIKEEDRLREAHQMLFGFTRSQNIPLALKIYEDQAGRGNIFAMNSLGAIYEQGKYVPKNLKKSIDYFLKSASNSNPEGLYKVGLFLQKKLVKTKQLFNGLYHNRQSEVRGAIGYLEKAAKEGHLDAITDLGYIYEKGIRNEQNPSKYYIEPDLEYAQKYYLKAKKQNFPRSYNNLGVFYLNNPTFGEVVQGDNNRRAIRYLEKAVQLGYPKAFFNLGRCYEIGQVVQKNIDKAKTLYHEGANKKDTQCKLAYALAIVRSQLSDDRRMAEAADMLREIIALDKDNNEAKFYLGLFCQKGIGVTKDQEAAFRYVESAAKNGYAPAVNKLGDFYYSGYGCKRDPEMALSLYQKAASEGYLQSYVNMGILYQQGYVSSGPSLEKAKQCYQQAANGGNPNGFVNLGLMTLNRNSTEDAQFFLKKAADMGNIYAMQVLSSKVKSPMVRTTHTDGNPKQNIDMNIRKIVSTQYASQPKSFRKSEAAMSDHYHEDF